MATPTDRAIAARVLKDAGQTPAIISDLLKVDLSQVYRYLQKVPTDGQADTQSAVDDLEALLETQTLDHHKRFNAGVARRLATRLDKVSVSEKAQDAMAMPQIAKELRAIVNEIMGASEGDKTWLAGLLSAVDDTKDAGP